MKITTKLWRHQQEMSDFVVARMKSDSIVEAGDGWSAVEIKPGYAWLLAGCGTGKTLVSYDVMARMGINRALVITTRAAASQAWVGDATRFTDGLRVLSLAGLAKSKKLHSLKNALDDSDTPVVIVINYESAWRIYDELAGANFDLVVADESHRLKTHNSKQSKQLTKLCANIPYRLAMTGTGWDDKPTDVYGQVRWMQPEIHRGSPKSPLLGSWSEFFDRYVIYHQHEHIKFVKGYKNLDGLRELIDPFVLYVDSEKVLDLPEELHIERRIDMTYKQAKVYDQLYRDMVVNTDDIHYVANSKLEVALRLHQITSGYLPTEDGGTDIIMPDRDNPKLQETLAILEELDGQPVVIFTRFTRDVLGLTEILHSEGYTVKHLTGERHEHEDWQNGEGQVLIANIQAGSAGVNLTRARYAIYFSIGHSRTDYTQSLARIRRPGADKNYPIVYYHLLMNGTVDIEIREAMLGKGMLSDYLLKGLTNVLS